MVKLYLCLNEPGIFIAKAEAIPVISLIKFNFKQIQVAVGPSFERKKYSFLFKSLMQCIAIKSS